jgi:NAD(P)-dependent dehydrogenase (short-subunit alcohol dehydrogenase family)
MCDHVLQPAAQEQQRPEVALIVGGGPGISGACARLFAAEGMRVAIAARSPDKLEIQEIIEASMVSGGSVCAFKCDVSDTASVEALFAVVEAELGPPDVVIYNPSGRARGPVAELDPEEVKQSLLVTAFGGFLVGQQAARRMIERGSGSILFTGASASYKGYANSSAFAMGKFGLTGVGFVGEYISRYAMSLKGLECQVSKLVNRDACLRLATQAWRSPWRGSLGRGGSTWRTSRSTAASPRSTTRRGSRQVTGRAVRAARGRLSALIVFHSKTVFMAFLYGRAGA